MRKGTRAAGRSPFAEMAKRQGYTLKETAAGAGIDYWRVSAHSAGYLALAPEDLARVAAFWKVKKSAIPVPMGWKTGEAVAV